MSGSMHYALATQLLAEAKDADPEADHADVMLLLKFAELHVGLAQAAATALGVVLPLVGGDSTEVTAWARMIGALDDTGQADVVEAVVYPTHWPPTTGDLWANATGRRWLARRVPDGIQMVSCWDSDPWDGGPPDFCSPDELLKADMSLVLLNREEPPF